MSMDCDFSKIIEASVQQHPELFKTQSESVADFRKKLAETVPVDILMNPHPTEEQRDYVCAEMVKYITDKSNSFYDRYCILSDAITLKFKTKELAEITIAMLDEVPQNYTSNAYHVWELFDILYSLGFKDFKDDYIRFADSPVFKSIDKQMLFMLFGKLKNDESYAEIIIAGLADEDLNGHALAALNKFRDSKYDKYFSPFLNDKRAWVRKTAEKRLNT